MFNNKAVSILFFVKIRYTAARGQFNLRASQLTVLS